MRLGSHDTLPEGWTDLVAADAGADAWHCPLWLTTVARHRPGARPLWLTAHEDGRLVGGLAALVTGGALGRIDSGPDGTAGGPLVRDDLPADQAGAVARRLLDGLVGARGGLLRGCGVALNTVHEQRWADLLLADGRFRRTDTPAAVIDLVDGADAARARFNKAKRNELSRGLRRGCEPGVTTDPDDIAAWHALHVQAAAHWGVAPVAAAMVRDLVTAPPADDGTGAFLVCVRAEGRIAGGHLVLHRGRWATAWLGVTDPALARTHFPATVAVWGDLQEAERRGARRLDLGASGGIGSLEGFKRYLGATELPRGWYQAETLPRRLLRRLRPQRSGGPRWHDGREAPR